MSTGEIMGLATLIGSVFTMMGITGIDSGMINGAVQGIIAIFTLGAAIWSWYEHKKTANT